MSLISHLQCTRCGARYPADSIMNLCPVDNSPVEIIMDLQGLATQQPDLCWYRPERNDMWRFGGLLPLDINNPDDQPHIFCLGEGNTPLLDYSDHPQAKQAGFSLLVKDEGKTHDGYGANPTQSFKDRGMAMSISMAHKAGISKLAVPTQGNAGDSWQKAPSRAGKPLPFVPSSRSLSARQGRARAAASKERRASTSVETQRSTCLRISQPKVTARASALFSMSLPSARYSRTIKKTGHAFCLKSTNACRILGIVS